MHKNRIGALVAAAALTLTFTGTAFANDLHQDTPIVGTDFDNTEVGCDEGWHFIHTKTDSGDLPSEITVEFQDAGVLHVAGHVNGNSIVMYDVTGAEAGDTLLSASDDIENEGLLNLSHVCLPEETTTTTTEETTTDTTTTDVETTTDETTTTDTTTTDVVTTDTTTTDVVTTDTTTTDVVTTDTTSEETTPEGSVEELTPPSTDTIGQPTSSSSVSTGLLLVLAGILAAVLVVVPAAARNRR
jgi:hypothetical protein